MTQSLSHLRAVLLVSVLAVSQISVAGAAEPARVVMQNGRSLPLTALTLQGPNLVVSAAAEGFQINQVIPLQTADHVYGEKPAEINQAVANLLTGKPRVARQLLEPIVAAHRITAKISGNFWLEAARALLVAHAINGESAECTAIGKEISESAITPGTDPFVALGKALLMSVLVKTSERETALRDLTNDKLPADLCAYAAYFCGNLLKKDKRNSEALEAYLTVPTLYPSGGLVLNAAAGIQAADLLTAPTQREEATALLRAAIIDAVGTPLVAEANKRLDSLK